MSRSRPRLLLFATIERNSGGIEVAAINESLKGYEVTTSARSATGARDRSGIVRSLAFFLVAAAVASPAFGSEWSLLVNGKAKHVDVQAGRHYNERNWGAGLQYDFIEPGRKWIPFVNVSEFQDSNRNLSYYAGGGINRRFTPLPGTDSVHVDVGAVGFAMHRKGFKGGNLFPGILPVVSVGTDRLSLNITYIPKIDPKMVPLWFFQLKVGLSWQ